MNQEMNSPEQYIAAIRIMKESLDIQQEIRCNGLRTAPAHWCRRYSDLCASTMALYAWKHNNGPKPDLLPSQAANARQGKDSRNIYFMCKELSRDFPWKLPRHHLMEPTAVMLKCLDVLNVLYPCEEVYRGTLLAQAFTNLWTRPKSCDPNFEKEREARLARYLREVENLQLSFESFHDSLSTFFAKIEDERLDKRGKNIRDTAVLTKKIAKKVGVKSQSTSLIAQEKALAIWNEYRNNPEVKMRYCKPRHRITYADVLDYCKRSLIDLGFMSAAAFEKAVKAKNKRSSRGTK